MIKFDSALNAVTGRSKTFIQHYLFKYSLTVIITNFNRGVHSSLSPLYLLSVTYLTGQSFVVKLQPKDEQRAQKSKTNNKLVNGSKE